MSVRTTIKKYFGASAYQNLGASRHSAKFTTEDKSGVLGTELSVGGADSSKDKVGDEPLTDLIRLELARRGTVEPQLEDITDALSSLHDTHPGSGSASYGKTQPVHSGVGDSALLERARQIEKDLSGLGPVIDWLSEPQVTDVLINPNGDVAVDRGAGVEICARRQFTPGQLRHLAVNLAAQCGSRLDDACPFADGILTKLPHGVWADGIRVHVALSPPMWGGASVSLRVLTRGMHSLEALVQSGFAAPDVEKALRAIVASRKNILISGGTGTGKTTLLAALMECFRPSERTIVVEDTSELMPTHAHILKMQTRRANAEGKGAIDMRELIKQSLRMRPDRIVVGEVRGAEISDLLVAFNTGHAGSAGTLHANSAQAVPGRLLALGAMAGMTEQAVAYQAVDGIDYLLHVERNSQGRHVAQISTLEREGREMRVQPLWPEDSTRRWTEFLETMVPTHASHAPPLSVGRGS
ncbi:TadA family conjugal transfer-associated ATPase [Corynebacterium sp. 4HC-13]|uniref:TadA family conjugal transfer-associated ATPase n=1 Tax=Corynebacterium anserum TaxID=2684406 RepID=UPI00163A757F|nr:TadA family conjugal transfer-associated ATPase [Corynebacterium anserum]MBC2682388.1 TadA family conjugal transfer-associated ATPase [Corynebacterium anserum]